MIKTNTHKILPILPLFIIMICTGVLFFINPHFSSTDTLQSKATLSFQTPYKSGIRFITFNYSLSNIITFGYNGIFIKWDLNNLKKISSISLNKTNVTDVSITSDKSIISIGYSDGAISFIDLNSFKLIKSFTLPDVERIISTALTNDKKFFLVVDSNKTMNIYSFEDGKLYRTIKEDYFTGYNPIVNINERIIAFYNTEKIIIYSLHDYSILNEFELEGHNIIYGIIFCEGALFFSCEDGDIYEVDYKFSNSINRIHKNPENKWIENISCDCEKNIVYNTDDAFVYYLEYKSKKLTKLYKSTNDIMNLELNNTGKYISFTDLSFVNVIEAK